MSYSLLCKNLFERKHEGQPHYTRKWNVKNAKPTGLTEAQRHIAAPPDGGRPASPIYAFFDISQLKPDWEPGMLEIVERPELGTEYAKLDNGFWYLLEEDGRFKHMTDREFEEFLAWKRDHETVEEEDTTMEEWKEEDEEVLAEFDAAEETINSSLELLNSEIEELDSEMEAIDSELEESNQNSDSGDEVADGHGDTRTNGTSNSRPTQNGDILMNGVEEEEEPTQMPLPAPPKQGQGLLQFAALPMVDRNDMLQDEKSKPNRKHKVKARRWRKTETLFDEFGRLDTWKNWRRKHCSQARLSLQRCHWQMIRITDRWALPQTKPGVPKLTVTTPEGLCFWLNDPINYNYQM